MSSPIFLYHWEQNTWLHQLREEKNISTQFERVLTITVKKAPICGSESIKLPAYISVDQEAESSGQNQDRDKPQVCPPVTHFLSLSFIFSRLHNLSKWYHQPWTVFTDMSLWEERSISHPNHNKFIINKLEMEETKCGNNEQFLDAKWPKLNSTQIHNEELPLPHNNVWCHYNLGSKQTAPCMRCHTMRCQPTLPETSWFKGKTTMLWTAVFSPTGVMVSIQKTKASNTSLLCMEVLD